MRISTSLIHFYTCTEHVTIDNVMPREKRWGALDSCFGLVGPHQQSIPQLLSLASRVYKGKVYRGKVERSTCGSEHVTAQANANTLQLD